MQVKVLIDLNNVVLKNLINNSIWVIYFFKLRKEVTEHYQDFQNINRSGSCTIIDVM